MPFLSCVSPALTLIEQFRVNHLAVDGRPLLFGNLAGEVAAGAVVAVFLPRECDGTAWGCRARSQRLALQEFVA